MGIAMEDFFCLLVHVFLRYSALQDEFLFAWLEVIVIPELLAGDDLCEMVDALVR